MWPLISAIPGLRIVQRWANGHICMRTDTGYFKVIIGLARKDFEAWRANDFKPEHEYMTFMSTVPLIDKLNVETYTYHQIADSDYCYGGKFKTAMEEGFGDYLCGAAAPLAPPFRFRVPYRASTPPPRRPHVAPSTWFDTVVREVKLNYGGDDASLTRVQKVIDEYLPEIAEKDGFKWAHRLVNTETHEFRLLLQFHEYEFGKWQLEEFNPEEDFLDDLKHVPGVTDLFLTNATIQPCWPPIVPKVDPQCTHCGK